MPEELIGFLRRVTARPCMTFRFARANALFVLLVARELVAQTVAD